MNNKLYTSLMIVLMLSVLGVFSMAMLSIPFNWVTAVLSFTTIGSLGYLLPKDFTS